MSVQDQEPKTKHQEPSTSAPALAKRIRSGFSIFNSQFSILLVLLLALALRLLLWSQPLHQLANDEVEYVAVARDLLAGRGWQFYEHYHWLRAPLYPLFLAGGARRRALEPIRVGSDAWRAAGQRRPAGAEAQ